MGSPRTKEQIAQDIKNNAEVKRRREIVRDKLMPLLLAEATSIQHASMLCYTLDLTVDRLSQKLVNEMKISDLGIEEFFAKANISADQEKVRKILEIVQDETIASFKTIVGAFPQVIDGAVRVETGRRPFSELEIKLLD